MFYPSALSFYLFVVKPHQAAKEAKLKQLTWDNLPKPKKVDPDIFNPFTPIPYHNNPELTYAFAHINMHGYLNNNQINPATYVWKDFHNSYDHNHKNSYMYDWVSIHSNKD